MAEWKIRRIIKNNMDHFESSTSIITFDQKGNLVQDIMRKGKRKEVNYSRINFLFWNYERKENYDGDNYRDCNIKIRNMKGRLLAGLYFSDSKFCGLTIYDKNEKKKFDWDDTFGNSFLTLYKKGKEKFEYSKMILTDSETDTYYNNREKTFYNSRGNKTVVIRKNKYKKAKTVYIYNSQNQIFKEIFKDLKTHKVISETLYEYNKNNDLIYSCTKSGTKILKETSYSYNENHQLLKGTEINFDEFQKPESQLDEIFSYDAGGRLIRETFYKNDSKQYEKNMEYDDFNRIIKKTEFSDSYRFKEFFYKYKNNLCVEEDYICYNSDGTIYSKQKDTYKYDEAGNKIQQVHYNHDDNYEITLFDKFGNEISITTYNDKSEVVKSEIVFRDINGIAYMTCQNDKTHIVKTNSSGMPVEIYPPYIPGDTYYGEFRRSIIEYEYFK